MSAHVASLSKPYTVHVVEMTKCKQQKLLGSSKFVKVMNWPFTLCEVYSSLVSSCVAFKTSYIPVKFGFNPSMSSDLGTLQSTV